MAGQRLRPVPAARRQPVRVRPVPGLPRQLRRLLRPRASAITAPTPGQPRVREVARRGRLLPVLRARAHGPGGYYSFDLGGWHVVSLDSTICGAGGVECMPGPHSTSWLAADLAASDATCTLAFWHHPRWDWLKYQNADWTDDYELRRTEPLWDLLYARRCRRGARGSQPQLLAMAADGRRRQVRPGARHHAVHRRHGRAATSTASGSVSTKPLTVRAAASAMRSACSS